MCHHRVDVASVVPEMSGFRGGGGYGQHILEGLQVGLEGQSSFGWVI